MKLPPEIRNDIYERACLNGPITITSWRSRKGYQGASGLLHACQQIRFEVQPLFYRHTTINLGMLRGNIRKIDRFSRMPIKSISLINELVWLLVCRALYTASSDRHRQYRATRELGKLMPNIEHLYVEVNAVERWEAHRQLYEAGFRQHSGMQHVQFHYRKLKRKSK